MDGGAFSANSGTTIQAPARVFSRRVRAIYPSMTSEITAAKKSPKATQRKWGLSGDMDSVATIKNGTSRIRPTVTLLANVKAITFLERVPSGATPSRFGNVQNGGGAPETPATVLVLTEPRIWGIL